MDQPNTQPGPTIVGLGEALFDCFPNRTVLGGAPINVSVHAAALLSRAGGSGLPATRVGDDELGQRFFDELRGRGIDCSAVQVDPEAPTGRVDVTVDKGGHASYEFAANVAWDRLEPTDAWDQLAARCQGLVFGTLAQRSEASRQAVQRFVAKAESAVRLFDVNLRGDFYSADMITESLNLATAAKLNEDELVEVPRLLGLVTDSGPNAVAERLVGEFGLDWLALTRGSEGTVLYQGEGRFESPPDERRWYDPRPDADTVGAGDACCAALLVGATLGWPPERTLQLANAAGAVVASQPGATPVLPDELLRLVDGG